MFGRTEGEDDDAPDDEEDEEEDELTFAGSALIPANGRRHGSARVTSTQFVESARLHLVAWVSSSTAPLTSVFICSTFQSTRSSKVP